MEEGNKIIKKLSKEYVEDILKIHEDSIFPIWDELGREYSEWDVRMFILDVFSEGEVYGYFVDKKLVGCVGIKTTNKECELCFILVLTKFKGKGIGKKMMVFIEKLVKSKSHKIFLEVLKENNAVDFYKRLDYKIVKEIVREKNRKYVMEKDI